MPSSFQLVSTNASGIPLPLPAELGPLPLYPNGDSFYYTRIIPHKRFNMVALRERYCDCLQPCDGPLFFILSNLMVNWELGPFYRDGPELTRVLNENSLTKWEPDKVQSRLITNEITAQHSPNTHFPNSMTYHKKSEAGKEGKPWDSTYPPAPSAFQIPPS